MKDFILQNISWLFTALSLLGNVFVIKKSVKGQWIWAVSNVCWVVYFFHIHEWASGTLFAAYFGLCVWGILEWSEKK